MRHVRTYEEDMGDERLAGSSAQQGRQDCLQVGQGGGGGGGGEERREGGSEMPAKHMCVRTRR